MRIDPEQSHSLIPPLSVCRNPGHGAHRNRVIAAQVQREVAQSPAPLDLASNAGGRTGNLREIPGTLVTDLELLHVLDDDVTLVHHLVPQLRETIGDSCNANGGG